VLFADCFHPANLWVCAYVSSLKGERNGSKKIEFQKQVQKELKLEEEIQWPQVQQEGGSGSAHGNAPHAVRQAQGEEPEAGNCYRAFQSAAEGRKGPAQKIIQPEESGLIRSA
jgi:hypothetical protein